MKKVIFGIFAILLITACSSYLDGNKGLTVESVERADVTNKKYKVYLAISNSAKAPFENNYAYFYTDSLYKVGDKLK